MRATADCVPHVSAQALFMNLKAADRSFSLAATFLRSQAAGGPFKPFFGLSGAFARWDKFSLPLAHVFLRPIRI